MKKLSNEEIKNIAGGLYGCIALWDYDFATYWHEYTMPKTKRRITHWDYDMGIVSNGGRLKVFGH